MYEEGIFGTEERNIDDKKRIFLGKFGGLTPDDELALVKNDYYLEVVSKDVVINRIKKIREDFLSTYDKEEREIIGREMDCFVDTIESLSCDKQGRVKFRKELLEEYEMVDKVVIVGYSDSIRIYSKEYYNANRKNRSK